MRPRRLDPMTPAERSAQMALVKAADTKPEILVRQLVHRLGFRFRLHRKDLPGKPDLVFASRGCVIFVHGCFWHRHENCARCRLPKSRQEFWREKLEGNRLRDQRTQHKLKKLGWRVMVIWECQIRADKRLEGRIKRFLDAER